MPQRILMHVVPHTHLDAGWIETIDVYMKQKVNTILRSVFEQLS